MATFHGTGMDGKFWYKCLLIGTSSPKTLDDFSPLKLKTGEPQFKYHVGILRKVGASLEVVSERVKNNERAQDYRNIGNKFFSSNEDTIKAAEMYTKSIAHAVPGSRELALAYANRSAVSYKAENYEGCLLDIERSLENDYPDEMKAKLYARRLRCLGALVKSSAEIERALEDTREALLKMDLTANGRNLVEKTLNDQNHMAPTTSTKKPINELEFTVEDDGCDIRGATGVTVQYSEKYGRHIIATRDIRPGEIIAAIGTYATATIPTNFYRGCAQCIIPTTVGIPCDHCVNVIYCSTSCRDKAWNDYHEYECPILGILLDLGFPEMAILIMRITLKAVREAGGVHELREMLKEIDSCSDPRVKGFTGSVLDCTKYASIYTLASNITEQDSGPRYLMSLRSTFTIYYLATRTGIFGRKYDAGLQLFDEDALLDFLGGLMIRNYEIGQFNVTGFHDWKRYLKMTPFFALCKHSCDFNATYLRLTNNVVLALKPISAGEQISDCYGGRDYSSSPKAERQKNLKKYWRVTCDCVACINDWPMLEKLPSAHEVPGMSLTIKNRLAYLQATFLKKYNLSLVSGDKLAAKDELVQILELLYEHACPSKEMITYRQLLIEMHDEDLDLA